jgi:hypothetical protein
MKTMLLMDSASCGIVAHDCTKFLLGLKWRFGSGPFIGPLSAVQVMKIGPFGMFTASRRAGPVKADSL